jgi:hypothetical protein
MLAVPHMDAASIVADLSLTMAAVQLRRTDLRKPRVLWLGLGLSSLFFGAPAVTSAWLSPAWSALSAWANAHHIGIGWGELETFDHFLTPLWLPWYLWTSTMTGPLDHPLMTDRFDRIRVQWQFSERQVGHGPGFTRFAATVAALRAGDLPVSWTMLRQVYRQAYQQAVVPPQARRWLKALTDGDFSPLSPPALADVLADLRYNRWGTAAEFARLWAVSPQTIRLIAQQLPDTACRQIAYHPPRRMGSIPMHLWLMQALNVWRATHRPAWPLLTCTAFDRTHEGV